MMSFLKSLVGIGAVAIAPLTAPSAYAQCGTSLPVRHFKGGYFIGLPEANLSGRVFVFQNPSINSGAAAFMCGQCERT